ncbi:hypothetical protein [Paludisphaera mucosa]|uniref:Uncharacterized protein n=1 Tax=Paludisphaera mucosa TaxID=3030827 RepID=A0ABT6FA92_9BACT|nr:hypothetical protein [Paludisphaera mucosa]MDG3004354.1 hypothetical protein [Paludisphaera mucosa]
MINETLASRFFRVINGGLRKPRRRASFKPAYLMLEDRRLPAAIVPIPQTNPRVALSTIFWNGEPTPLNSAGLANVPAPASVGAAKTVTITNGSSSTIYPFLRGQNGGIDPNATPQAPYDPQDLANKEFREYIGYTGPAGRQYLGLPAGASITIQVPLALWDGDNLFIATDGSKLTSPSLFGYNPKASISIAAAAPVSGTTWVQGSSGYAAGFKPLVMFYFSNQPLTLPNDAPAQLTELTFRDQYLTRFINDPNQTFPLINYDVSYVNNMVAPVSMEASHAPITYQTNPSPAPPTYFGYQDFGWLATNRTTTTFEGAISNFTKNVGSASVGQYFGGKGWPEYYDPNPANFNIPSGANLFDNSPLTVHGGLVHTSTYDPNRWLLTSSGSAPIQAGGGGFGQQGFTNAQFPNRLYFNNTSPRFVSDLQAMLKAGTVNLTYPGQSQVLATVGKLVPNPNGRPYVTLSGKIESSGPSGKVYAFTRTATDYATTAITNLWYSWAQYYVQQQQSLAPASAQGTLNFAGAYATNRITLTSAPTLAVGMTVSAPAGVPAGTTILKIVGNDVYLSQIPADDTPATQEYSFGKPQPIAYDPNYTTPYALTFTADATAAATQFAGSVYEAMAVEAGVDPLPQPYLPYSMGVVAQVIQFYAKIPGYDRKNDTGSDLVGQVRDVVKSILRGVYDYQAVPDQTKWYPNPSQKPVGLTSNQNFNVFNLDPYVWFVHDVQQMSAYGFSVDDDVSNPTATGPLLAADGTANHYPNALQIQFGGADKLGNKSQWFPTIPWGTLNPPTATLSFLDAPGNAYDGAPIVTFQGANALTYYNQINNPGAGQVGATISAPGFLPPGTQLIHKGPVSGLNPQIVLQLPKNTTMTPTATPIPVTITA